MEKCYQIVKVLFKFVAFYFRMKRAIACLKVTVSLLFSIVKINFKVDWKTFFSLFQIVVVYGNIKCIRNVGQIC